MNCYGQVKGNGWTQEWYETASRDARKRAKQLRNAGYRVSVSAGGLQVTSVGMVKMTMVDIRGNNENLPEVKITRL